MIGKREKKWRGSRKKEKMTVWKRKDNSLYAHSCEEEEEEGKLAVRVLSCSERSHFVGSFVGNSDPRDKSRSLVRYHITGILIINSIGYTKGHICCNSKSRTQEI